MYYWRKFKLYLGIIRDTPELRLIMTPHAADNSFVIHFVLPPLKGHFNGEYALNNTAEYAFQ